MFAFIFEKILEKIDYGCLKNCDNRSLLNDLCVSRLISEEQYHNIASEAFGDKNR